MTTDTDRVKPREVWGATMILRAVREVGFPIAIAVGFFWYFITDAKENGKKLDRIVTILDERLPKK